nr:uncharacterized protein LOC109180485 [Ipomoea trifida]
MEWTTLQHLDLRHVGRSSKPLQPHAAAFHPLQALVSVAVGTYVIGKSCTYTIFPSREYCAMLSLCYCVIMLLESSEFDAYTGCKIAAIDIGSPVVRMAYSPTSGNAVIAILEDCTIRSCDFDTEQTCVLHSPEKTMERISSDTEVHLALTPLQPVVFFGFHRRMSVTGW